MDEEQADGYDFPSYPLDSYYDIELRDGTVQVFIMGMYSYNAYMAAAYICHYSIISPFLCADHVRGPQENPLCQPAKPGY